MKVHFAYLYSACLTFRIPTKTFLCIIVSGVLVLAGCVTRPESNPEILKEKYSQYTTPQLQLRRQEIANSIPAFYWGTGLVGAVQQNKMEAKKNQVTEIDRELLRRAETGDNTGQKSVSFWVVSDPPGAKIEGDGRYFGNAPTAINYTGNLGATATLRATPATLDHPILGIWLGTTELNGKTIFDSKAFNVVTFVSPNSPASRMGLTVGDKIIGINNVSLPDVTGNNESNKNWKTILAEQLSRSGFGGDVTLKILRDGTTKDLRGQTSEQLIGEYYVQQKKIQPMLFDKQVVMFDMRVQTDAPLYLGSSSERKTASKGATYAGTGFVVAEGGYVLTCEHVISKSEDIEVRDAKGGRHSAKVVASDAENDLCLLKSEAMDIKPIPAAPPNSVSTGETIYCLGFPMEGVLENVNPVVGSGVVASLRGLKGDTRHLQVTVPINPGNSGGPILDSYGRWVAVASHKLNDIYGLTTTGQSPQGVNFAVKGSLAMTLFDSIPEVRLPMGEAKDKIDLENTTKQFSGSIVFITAKH